MERTLTKRTVDAAKVAPDRGETWLWDTKVTGFGLRVRSGGRKDYFLKYGMGRDGVARKVLIGRHGKGWTVDTARDEATRLQGERAHGKDPGARKAFERGIPTVEELAARYLSDYAEPHKKPRTVIEDRALLGLDARKPRTIAAELGNARLDKVTGDDVTRFHLSLRSTPTRANRALALMSHMFTMAEKWKVLPFGSNPCRGVERFKEKKRERFLSLEELARVGKVLDVAERAAKAGKSVTLGAENPFAVAAIRLLIFTGCRLSEILTMRWRHVDLSRGTLVIPEPKEGKPKMVVLNAPAAKVFAGLPRLEKNPFVIAGRREGDHLTDLEHPWMRLRAKAGLEGVRLHDLRHSFASVAVAGGASLPIIGALLGHSQPQTTARYAHLSADPLRAASEAIGAQIAAAMSPKGDSHASKRGDVLPMSRRGALGA
jgi:integrase